MREYFDCDYNDDGCGEDRLYPSERLDAKPTKKLQSDYDELHRELIKELAWKYFGDVDEWNEYEWEDFEQMARGW